MADSPRPFRVVYPGTVRDQLQEWGRHATDPELRTAFAEALTAIDTRLAADPLAWGEPSYHLHHLGFTVCDGFHARLQVRFGVDEARRIVYVSWFKLLPGHPLAPPP
jgi:hypothetical protein